MLTFAIATAGITVFAPSPVKPLSSPFTSNVGRAQTRSSTEYPVSPASFGAPRSLAILLLVERQLLPRARSSSDSGRTSS